jgi:CheY-like chemotaxis protein
MLPKLGSVASASNAALDLPLRILPEFDEGVRCRPFNARERGRPNGVRVTSARAVEKSGLMVRVRRTRYGAEREREESAMEQNPLADCRVLVVEDEYFIADDIGELLTQQGVTVMGPVGTLREARSLIGKEAFDVAVLDVNLHGEMSYPIADDLQRRGVPFLFATGYSDHAIPARFAGVPRCDKPFNDGDLVARVRQLCHDASRAGRIRGALI